MKLPQELNSQTTTDTARISLKLSKELFWFQGHFPDSPILPGVAQLTWVFHYAHTQLGLVTDFKAIEVMKFQRPLFPEETVELILKWDRNNNHLHFQYVYSEQTVSTGKIILCS